MGRLPRHRRRPAPPDDPHRRRRDGPDHRPGREPTPRDAWFLTLDGVRARITGVAIDTLGFDVGARPGVQSAAADPRAATEALARPRDGAPPPSSRRPCSASAAATPRPADRAGGRVPDRRAPPPPRRARDDAADPDLDIHLDRPPTTPAPPPPPPPATDATAAAPRPPAPAGIKGAASSLGRKAAAPRRQGRRRRLGGSQGRRRRSAGRKGAAAVGRRRCFAANGRLRPREAAADATSETYAPGASGKRRSTLYGRYTLRRYSRGKRAPRAEHPHVNRRPASRARASGRAR